jgi:hypothetical protein
VNEGGVASEAESVSVDADCGDVTVGEEAVSAASSFAGVAEALEREGERAEEASDADEMEGGGGAGSSVASFGVEAVLEASEPVPGLSNDFLSGELGDPGVSSTKVDAGGSPSRTAASSGAEDVSG